MSKFWQRWLTSNVKKIIQSHSRLLTDAEILTFNIKILSTVLITSMNYLFCSVRALDELNRVIWLVKQRSTYFHLDQLHLHPDYSYHWPPLHNILDQAWSKVFRNINLIFLFISRPLLHTSWSKWKKNKKNYNNNKRKQTNQK